MKRVRFRFYDLSFEVLKPLGGLLLAPTTGRFREASFGVPAAVGTLQGECSALLWSDSEIYLMWAREAFGWPVFMGEITLDGDVWIARDPTNTRGSAKVTDAWGSVTLSDLSVQGPKPAKAMAGAHEIQAKKGNWFVPRRVFAHGTDDNTELLNVHPTVRSAGTIFDANGRLDFAFNGTHPLQGLTHVSAEFEFQDGIELSIGDDVEVL